MDGVVWLKQNSKLTKITCIQLFLVFGYVIIPFHNNGLQNDDNIGSIDMMISFITA